MKRTNLVLDKDKLERAKAMSGSRTYSETVNRALEEYLRRHTFATIDQFAASGVWEGDLTEMREDTHSDRDFPNLARVSALRERTV
ncbi:MAG: type II toxin-antitoxin system VapB family antitoxin [Alkalispirochaeta sp.]|jgi:hypothetical protein